MANLPQNSSYIPSGGGTGNIAANIGSMLRKKGTPFAREKESSPQVALQGQKNAIMDIYAKQANIQPGQQFLPITTPPRQPLPIPGDYGGFAEGQRIPNTSLSWATPNAPQINNLVSGDTPGQYVLDPTQPKEMIKSTRGYNPREMEIIRNGRPGFLYQVDHTVPLALGGADTPGNKQLLTIDQHDKKTRAQAVPYTLYVNGVIPLNAARTMAMQWKDRDLSDIPQPDKFGVIPIDVAKAASERWTKPKAPGFKEVMAEIPEAMKNFGEGYLPNGVREFIKGFGSGGTLGFLPYEADDGVSKGAKLSGQAGLLIGGVASFFVGSALVGGIAKGAGIGGKALMGLRGTATKAAAQAGFETAEAVGTNIAKEVTFKSLNKTPTYLQQLLHPETLKRAGKIGVSFAAMGQAQQLIANKFNPYVLSGQVDPKEQEHMIGTIFKDLAVGSIAGIAAPTLRGAALATMLPTSLAFIENPDNPMEALTHGVIFGALHMTGALGKKQRMNEVMAQFEETANKAAYNSLGYYAPEILPALKAGERVPMKAVSFETAQNAKAKAVENIWKRHFTQGDMTLADTVNEIKRVTASAHQLWKGSLPPKLREKADIDDLLSYGKGNLQKRFDSLQEFGQPSIAKQAAGEFDDRMMQMSFSEFNKQPPSGKYPVGDMAVTGSGLDINTPQAKYFFEMKDKGLASPNIILIDRPDAAAVWKIKNNLITKEQIAEGTAKPDLMPNNSLQAFGLVKNPETGAKELVDLGWVGTNFRINEGKYAFNKEPAVLKYIATNGAEGFPPIKMEKDQISSYMKKEGLSVLVANLDPRATVATKKSSLPFIPVNVNDKNWEFSKTLASKLAGTKKTSVQADIAEFNSTMNAKAKTEALAQIKAKIKQPADEILPAPEPTVTPSKPIAPVDNTISVPKEVTERALTEFRLALKSESPEALKTYFEKRLGIKFTDEQAVELFNNRNQIIVRQAPDMLINAANSGNATPQARVRIQLVKSYLESDAYRISKLAKIWPNMKILGGIDSAPVAKTKTTTAQTSALSSVEPKQGADLSIPPQQVKTPVKPVEPVTSKETVTPEVVVPSQSSSVVTPSETSAPRTTIQDRIVSNASREIPILEVNRLPISTNIPKGISQRIPSGGSKPLSKIDEYIQIGKDSIDDFEFKQGEAYQTDAYVKQYDTVIKKVLSTLETDLSARPNLSKNSIDRVKAEVKNELERHKTFRLEELDRTPPDGSRGGMPDELTGMKEFMPTKNAIEAPEIPAKEFYNYIDTGLQSEATSAQFFGAKAWDSALRSLFGTNYKTSPEAARFLSTKSKEGSSFWNDIFFRGSNLSGREITQPKDIQEGFAAGDMNTVGKAIERRRTQLRENPIGDASTMTASEKRALDVNSKDSMSVLPDTQTEGMVRDLVHGEERLMPGIASEAPMTASQAVRDVRSLFLNKGTGLLTQINKFRLATGGKKASLKSSIFAELEKAAKEADAKVSLDKSLAETSTQEAQTAIAALNKKVNALTKALEVAPDERLNEALDDTIAQLEHYSKLMENVSNSNKTKAPQPKKKSLTAADLLKL